MENKYAIKSREISELSSFENALNFHSLWEHKFRKKIYFLKWSYVRNRDEFVRKFKIQYPNVTSSEITNFIKIFLRASVGENNNEASDFVFEDGTWISRIFFLGPFLKDETNNNYAWLIENNGTGIYFP